ncbi:MAG: hypothetical protein NZ518_06950, partial [Dehalococcoidia bacterium]|nr:hypothetical protein [Dehalococcoidia bacterium]
MQHRPMSAALAVALCVALVFATACSGAAVEPVHLTGEVLFVQDGQIMALDLATRRERRVVELPAGGVASGPVWSPDGSLIAFSYYPPPTRNAVPGSSIFTVRADGSDLRPVRAHTTPGELLESPYFSPDGQSLVFTRFLPIVQNGQYLGDSLDLLRLDLRANQVTQIAKDAIYPSYSPDGRRIAFVGVAQDTFAVSLWVADANGGNRQQVVAPNQFASIYTPRWSPDGSSIAFSGAIIASLRPAPATDGRPAPGLARVAPGAWGAVGAPWTARPLLHGLPSDVYRVAPTPNSRPVRVTELNED